MRLMKHYKSIGLILILGIFIWSFIFMARHIEPAMAAEDQKLWSNGDWNVLTFVPKDWSWSENYAEDIPVVFIPTGEDDKGIPDFVFVTHLGKQSVEDLESLKKEYISGLKKDLRNFKLNSSENVSTVEGLSAVDLSYTFTEGGKPALGYDRLVFTKENILWAISFSAGQDDFKRLSEGAISIIDAFVFDAASWVKEKQKEES